MVAKNFKATEDVQRHLDKAENPTETFTEYHKWLEAVTGLPHDIKSVVLAVRMYGAFQQHNRDNGTGRARNAAKPVAPAKPVKSRKPAVDSTGEAESSSAGVRGARAARAAKPAADKAKPASKAPAAGKPAPKSGRRGAVAKPENAPY